MTTTTHHVNIPTDPADIPQTLVEQAPKSNRKRNGAILGVAAITVALIAIIGLTTTRNSEGGGVSAAQASAPGVSTTACFAALAAGSDLDGYMSDFAVIAADGSTAAFDHDKSGLDAATAQLNTLNPKISTARTTLAAQSAQCRRDLMGTN